MANNNDFTPAVAIAPGETIKENMQFLGMTQKELSKRLDVTEKHLSNIMLGKSAITHEMAIKLETVIGPSAEFWMNLDSNYQLTKIRLNKEKELEKDFDILSSIPYKQMSEYGWISETKKRKKRVLELREFFGVTTLSNIENSYQIAFRKHNQTINRSKLGELAWIRKVEKEGLNIDVDEFNKNKIEKFIPLFKEKTNLSLEELYPQMQDLCAQCGIAFVIVPYLKNTDICGATIWRKDIPIIALTTRGKKADIFWFTFFHELAHLLNHSDKGLHISYNNSSIEHEADKIARNYLIRDEDYKRFTKDYDYRNKEEIIKYANEIGVAPFVLLGRLQHDKLLEYSEYTDLKPSYDVKEIIK